MPVPKVVGELEALSQAEDGTTARARPRFITIAEQSTIAQWPVGAARAHGDCGSAAVGLACARILPNCGDAKRRFARKSTPVVRPAYSRFP
jgi:hypothetical protein